MKTFALNKRKPLFIVTFLCSIFFGFSQTTLTAGDIAITGVNARNPDEFAFVLLTFVLDGTTVNFTDKGWDNNGYFRNSNAEGVVSWTATSNLACGTEIIIRNTGVDTYSATNGTAVITDEGFGLTDYAGDQIIAYQGTLIAPRLLYAIQFGNAAGWSNSFNDFNSGVPLGLTDNLNAIDLGDFDNGNYNCAVTTDPALILNAVSDVINNWTLDNSRIPTLGACTYTCFTCSSTSIWNGAWDSGTPPDLNTEAIIVTDYDMTTLPSLTACSLTINFGATLIVDDSKYIEVENDIVNNGTLLVRSEGSVVQNGNFASVIGTASIEKFTALISNWFEYTYWSSPVWGETIENGLNESDPDRRYFFSAIDFVDSVYEVDNDGAENPGPGQDDIDDDGDDWKYASGFMAAGVGYVATHSQALMPPPPIAPTRFKYTFDGLMNNGKILVPVVRNDTEILDINWNLIGNPYPSAIDIDLFFTANNYLSNPNGTLTGAVYLWSQNTEPMNTYNGNENLNFNGDDYAIINGIGEIPGGDGLPPARFIPSGQGFFVSYSQVRPSTAGDVIFNNSMRVTGNNDQFFRSYNEENNRFALKLTTENGIFNQMLVGYAEGATDLLDEMYYDAPRNMSSRASAIIYSIIEDSSRKFAIQGRDINSMSLNDFIPIGIKSTVDEELEFTISLLELEGEFMNTNTIYLRDNLLNIEHNLSNSGYTFTLDNGEFNSRFEIFFSGTLSVNDLSLDSDELVISNNGEYNIEISTKDQSQIANIKIYDLLGRELYNIEANNEAIISLNASSLSNSLLIINVTTEDRKRLTKKFLNF